MGNAIGMELRLHVEGRGEVLLTPLHTFGNHRSTLPKPTPRIRVEPIPAKPVRDYEFTQSSVSAGKSVRERRRREPTHEA